MASTVSNRKPWNKCKLVGQKAPFKVKDIWALRVRTCTWATRRRTWGLCNTLEFLKVGSRNSTLTGPATEPIP